MLSAERLTNCQRERIERSQPLPVCTMACGCRGDTVSVCGPKTEPCNSCCQAIGRALDELSETPVREMSHAQVPRQGCKPSFCPQVSIRSAACGHRGDTVPVCVCKTDPVTALANISAERLTKCQRDQREMGVPPFVRHMHPLECIPLCVDKCRENTLPVCGCRNRHWNSFCTNIGRALDELSETPVRRMMMSPCAARMQALLLPACEHPFGCLWLGSAVKQTL